MAPHILACHLSSWRCRVLRTGTWLFLGTGNVANQQEGGRDQYQPDFHVKSPCLASCLKLPIRHLPQHMSDQTREKSWNDTVRIKFQIPKRLQQATATGAEMKFMPVTVEIESYSINIPRILIAFYLSTAVR